MSVFRPLLKGRMECLTRSHLIVCLFILLGSVGVADAAGRKYALVVGIESYDPNFLSGLDFAEDDATELANVLSARGFQVTLMTRRQKNPLRSPSTPKLILGQLERRLKNLRKADSVVFVFFGQCVRFKSPKQLRDGSNDLDFLCPADADLTKPDSLISMRKVYSLLGKCAAEKKLVLIDGDRNGALSKLGQAQPNVNLDSSGITPRRIPKGVWAIYGCSSSENTHEHADLKHGVFCYHVLQYLKGEAEDRYYYSEQISVRGLASFASLKTRNYALAKMNADQFPKLVGQTNEWSLGKKASGVVINGLGMTLRLIPAGEFSMGSSKSAEETAKIFGSKAEFFSDEHPKHIVQITKPYYLGIHEVTVGQFRDFVDATGHKTDAEKDVKGGYGFIETTGKHKQDPKYSWRDAGFRQTDDHPVINVSWNDAMAFCDWLSRAENHKYRLPTEAEWEYACRAGTTTLYSSGRDAESLAKVGNVPDATAKAKYSSWSTIRARDGFVKTAPGGSFRSNAFGIFDMHGNVFEWCSDLYGSYPDGTVVNPRGAAKSRYRVYRGGSWNFAGWDCRSAGRFRFPPASRNYILGFRVARSTD